MRIVFMSFAPTSNSGTRSRETSTLTPSDLLVSHISDSCLPTRSVAHSFMVLSLTARATIALRSVSTLHKSGARRSGHAVCSVDSFDRCYSPPSQHAYQSIATDSPAYSHPSGLGFGHAARD
ncbi:unnamed protein product [Mycena citricolor]|uniref:Uncharacterized protein n=1 Tax=Mycena citricolor TaxID=2018698 RepID=A0AAD2JX67_9AGAR|nr:unnamed protein product [Mycena citricolor]